MTARQLDRLGKPIAEALVDYLDEICDSYLYAHDCSPDQQERIVLRAIELTKESIKERVASRRNDPA